MEHWRRTENVHLIHLHWQVVNSLSNEVGDWNLRTLKNTCNNCCLILHTIWENTWVQGTPFPGSGWRATSQSCASLLWPSFLCGIHSQFLRHGCPRRNRVQEGPDVSLWISSCRHANIKSGSTPCTVPLGSFFFYYLSSVPSFPA